MVEEDRVFTVEKPKAAMPVKNGDYVGSIIDIVYRTTDNKYQYADVVIKPDGITKEKPEDEDTTIVYGFPCKTITPTNSFGKFIMNWHQFKIGDNVKPKEVLIGKRVAFTVANIPGQKDPTIKYPRIVKGTLVPLDNE